MPAHTLCTGAKPGREPDVGELAGHVGVTGIRGRCPGDPDVERPGSIRCQPRRPGSGSKVAVTYRRSPRTIGERVSTGACSVHPGIVLTA